MRLHPHESRALGYLLRHLIVGLAAAMVFEVLILATDLGGLRQLMWASEERWLLAALLLFGLSITFGSLAMGISIMVLGRERD
ncbi:MAG: hypothetical protein D6826_02080 [Alphaproteobacteria bacterium]|nr:MAG: hypothetical protein D6826_02080 [Alphaproteobacteria bacterium]